MVELAISLVVLLLLITAIVDGARVLFSYMALRDAAQEGSVFGSVEPGDTNAITAGCVMLPTWCGGSEQQMFRYR